MTILLDNVGADTVGDTFPFKGGPAIIFVRADNYDGGTVSVEIASQNDTAVRFDVLTDGAFIIDGTVKIDYLANGSLLRAVLTGATSPENVFVDVLQ